MIKIENLTKYYPSKLGKQYVFKDLNFSFPMGRSIALLGSNGAGKSTLFRMLAKSEYPNKGRIITDQNISWPIALRSVVHAKMTGQENARFIAKVNGIADIDEYERRVLAFAEIGQRYFLPTQSYSSGMKARLAFACATAIDFDVYLIDEATSVGDAKFREKAKEKLDEKSAVAGIIMVSHELDQLRRYCDCGVLINDGELTFYDDLEEAIAAYKNS
jgi:capsular polysaccharide transport system ATP-binding protein